MDSRDSGSAYWAACRFRYQLQPLRGERPHREFAQDLHRPARAHAIMSPRYGAVGAVEDGRIDEELPLEKPPTTKRALVLASVVALVVCFQLANVKTTVEKPHSALAEHGECARGAHARTADRPTGDAVKSVDVSLSLAFC